MGYGIKGVVLGSWYQPYNLRVHKASSFFRGKRQFGRILL
ncbi:hypothetical protein DSUL_20345 [Desulfovibrionales bacterium]